MSVLRWYVIYTQSRKESLANGLLRHRGFETFYPHYWKTIKHARKETRVMRALYPRYLFVGKHDWQGMGIINDTFGVSTVLYLGDEPFELSEKVMDSVRENCGDDGQTDAPKSVPDKPVFHKGDIVRITDGPWAGFEGPVVIDKKGTVQVILDVFRGKCPVPVPSGGLKLVHPQCGT